MSRILAYTLIDAIDRADPTRSHERKPSERMRDALEHRRIVRALLISTAAVAAIIYGALQ